MTHRTQYRLPPSDNIGLDPDLFRAWNPSCLISNLGPCMKNNGHLSVQVANRHSTELHALFSLKELTPQNLVNSFLFFHFSCRTGSASASRAMSTTTREVCWYPQLTVQSIASRSCTTDATRGKPLTLMGFACQRGEEKARIGAQSAVQHL